ncbi:hypothetical protein EDC45_1793 [Mesocricetibacter intestinalis]|uniref:Spermidine synthase n=1 Tax=Mesocricetibacter intestinalis TaxID=1521930 RepID=A0A4R6VA75_9PAST|nr:fused MFS/spermidine synthase [Mesocricetibacter intestinalis]TDQ56834.1 hypothetical protein EDC45_1793 [Mesocricetibacter intestinalis]
MKYYNLIIRFVFFMSGFSALIYQVTWQRLLFTAFGVDLESITIIISVFMAGLGLGAYWGGRIADKFPDKIIPFFALTEIGIGLFGFASPALINILQQLFAESGLAVMVLSIFTLLLFPTFLMGSTLPLLTSHMNQYIDNIGHNIGWLYFTNTLGAAISCFMLGFVLFNYLSITEVIILAAIINCLVAFTVLFCYRRKGIQNV